MWIRRPGPYVRFMFNSALRTPKASGSAPAVALRDVRKAYGRGEGAVVALDGVSAALSAGSFTAIMGPSGSGKSTFLNVAAGLDRPTSGSVALGDADLAHLSERRLTILRRERIGFVFQAFNLLPSLTVAQNIALPLRLDGRRLRLTVLSARGRLGAFTGALIALFAAAVLSMAWGMQLESILRTHPPVERYAGAAAVVTGQQRAGADHDVLLGERAGVSSALAARLAAVPGVRSAIGDVSVPAELGDRAAVAHARSSSGPTGQRRRPRGCRRWLSGIPDST